VRRKKKEAILNAANVHGPVVQMTTVCSASDASQSAKSQVRGSRKGLPAPRKTPRRVTSRRGLKSQSNLGWHPRPEACSWDQGTTWSKSGGRPAGRPRQPQRAPRYEPLKLSLRWPAWGFPTDHADLPVLTAPSQALPDGREPPASNVIAEKHKTNRPALCRGTLDPNLSPHHWREWSPSCLKTIETAEASPARRAARPG